MENRLGEYSQHYSEKNRFIALAIVIVWFRLLRFISFSVLHLRMYAHAVRCIRHVRVQRAWRTGIQSEQSNCDAIGNLNRFVKSPTRKLCQLRES